MKLLQLGLTACFLGLPYVGCVEAGTPIGTTGGRAGITLGGSNAGVGGSGGSSNVTPCGAINPTPFGCKFAWGAPNSGSNYANLDFVSTWIGDETNGGLQSWSATATNLGNDGQDSCGDCPLVESVANSASMVVFYAYFIGFQACKVGHFCDCNTSQPPNLCTNGAQWIRDNRAIIVNAYGQYAKAVYARSPNKPVIWWLEGDFIQYTYNGANQQTNALSYEEAGQVARDITCAIKSNEPNAVVAMNHSPWVADNLAQGFWGAQPLESLDLIWVQGPGDSDALTNSGAYNATTANYHWLHTFTGKNIMAETSFQSSTTTADRWSTTTASNIQARIANGVIGVMVNKPSTNYQTAIANLGSLSVNCN